MDPQNSLKSPLQVTNAHFSLIPLSLHRIINRVAGVYSNLEETRSLTPLSAVTLAGLHLQSSEGKRARLVRCLTVGHLMVEALGGDTLAGLRHRGDHDPQCPVLSIMAEVCQFHIGTAVPFCPPCRCPVLSIMTAVRQFHKYSTLHFCPPSMPPGPRQVHIQPTAGLHQRHRGGPSRSGRWCHPLVSLIGPPGCSPEGQRRVPA